MPDVASMIPFSKEGYKNINFWLKSKENLRLCLAPQEDSYWKRDEITSATLDWTG